MHDFTLALCENTKPFLLYFPCLLNMFKQKLGGDINKNKYNYSKSKKMCITFNIYIFHS